LITKSCFPHHPSPPLDTQGKCLLCRREAYVRDKAKRQIYLVRPEVKERNRKREETKRRREGIAPRIRLTGDERKARWKRWTRKPLTAEQRQVLRNKAKVVYRNAHPKRVRMWCKNGHLLTNLIAGRKCRECRTVYVKQRRKRDPGFRDKRLRKIPGRHTRDELMARYQEQQGRCFWCRQPLPAGYHRDHVIPISKGGTNGIDNIVLACPPCNVKKSNHHPLDLLLA